MARILMHTLLFPPDANSNAYMFADLARELQRLGHDITVLTTTPHYARDEASLKKQPLINDGNRAVLRSSFEGIPCFHIAVPARKGGIRARIATAVRFHFWALAYGMRKQFACDIVLSQSPPLSIGLLSAWLARRHRAKSIYIAQDIFPDGLIQQGRIKNPLLIRAIRILEHLVYSRSHAVTSISGGLVDALRPRVPSTTELRTIPNFVNTTLYHPLPRNNEFSREYGLNDKFVVSYVGNLGNAQDLSPVLAAARECKDLPVKFLLVGSGIKEESLARELKHQVLDNVHLIGYQTRELTPMINAASDLCLVLLSPHVRNFSFPSKVYTLMACGKPILLYGHPQADVARFVSGTGIGWVIPNGDIEGFVEKVRHLCQCRSELQACAERALTSVKEKYTAEVVARQYDDLIGSLLKR
jgi:colanic acid biosynthesis glycosyl transferase WcaI